MLTQIQTLLVKVRAEETAKNEQRIKVLYMQIGPHFLYNTLNSIKWMAVLNNQPGIKQMVESLMKLLGAGRLQQRGRDQPARGAGAAGKLYLHPKGPVYEFPGGV